MVEMINSIGSRIILKNFLEAIKRSNFPVADLTGRFSLVFLNK